MSPFDTIFGAVMVGLCAAWLLAALVLGLCRAAAKPTPARDIEASAYGPACRPIRNPCQICGRPATIAVQGWLFCAECRHSVDVAHLDIDTIENYANGSDAA